MKEKSKGLKIFALIISIILAVGLFACAVLIVNNVFDGLSENEILNAEYGSVLVVLIISFILAGIIPTIILKLTQQAKLSIVTIIISGLLDFIMFKEWALNPEGLNIENLGYGVAGAYAVALVITIIIIATSKKKIVNNEE